MGELDSLRHTWKRESPDRWRGRGSAGEYPENWQPNQLRNKRAVKSGVQIEGERGAQCHCSRNSAALPLLLTTTPSKRAILNPV